VDDETVHRLMPPHKIVRGFLPAPMPEELLEWAIDHKAEFTATVIDYAAESRQDATVRVSLSVRHFGPLEERLRRYVLSAAPAWIAEFGVSPNRIGRVELEFVAHNDGAFFTRHIDTETGAGWADNGMRILSAVCYLHRSPRAFSGGRLRLLPFGGNGVDDACVEIEPEHNMLVVFPSWAIHEVRPVTCPSREFADSRFAVNIWLRADVANVSAG
jgi:Rps23 Pro-64 3,4-dihydroxylase Tpa1-like proline 4-hydroxylase